MSFKPKFNASRRGLEQVLGTLERTIMEAVWNLDRPATVAEVQQGVTPERDYHTITTVMVRLCRKGLLHRDKVNGGVWHYVASLTREEFMKRVARDLLSGMLELAPTAAVASFVDLLDSRDPGSLEMLEKMIELKRASRRLEAEDEPNG
ncbi:MAG: BlaI/MecI/CopY family transcriptional regulator [Longimicrobiales bacterium]